VTDVYPVSWEVQRRPEAVLHAQDFDVEVTGGVDVFGENQIVLEFGEGHGASLLSADWKAVCQARIEPFVDPFDEIRIARHENRLIRVRECSRERAAQA